MRVWFQFMSWNESRAPCNAVVGVVAVVMGLNLMDVLPVSFPSLNVDVRDLPVPPIVVAYAAGLTFALAASPCSTPILAAILAFAATQDAPLLGASLLFTYSIGYIAPVIVAATATVRTWETHVCVHLRCTALPMQ